MLRCLLLFLILAVAVRAQVPIGASKKEVIDKLGWPKSTSTAGTREILYYPEFSILIINDRVEKLQVNPKDGNLPNTYSPPVIIPKRDSNASWSVTPKEIVLTPEEQLGPRPIQSHSPQPVAQRPKQPAQFAPVSTVPQTSKTTAVYSGAARPSTRQPTPQDTIGSVVFRKLAPWALLFGVILGLKLIFGKKLERKAEKTNDEFRRNMTEPERSALGLPPKLRPRPDPLKDGWTLELLKLLEWHRYEQVVAEYYRLQGNRAELTTFGADGGIDVAVYRPTEVTPFLLIQCKAWAHEFVGVALVRELFGVAAARRIPGTTFHTTSTYSSEARTFAASVNMELIDGPGFIERIKRLPLSAQITLHEFATAGDYTTPTCSRCGVKMVPKRNKTTGAAFWGCSNFPRCRNQMYVPA